MVPDNTMNNEDAAGDDSFGTPLLRIPADAISHQQIPQTAGPVNATRVANTMSTVIASQEDFEKVVKTFDIIRCAKIIGQKLNLDLMKYDDKLMFLAKLYTAGEQIVKTQAFCVLVDHTKLNMVEPPKVYDAQANKQLYDLLINVTEGKALTVIKKYGKTSDGKAALTTLQQLIQPSRQLDADSFKDKIDKFVFPAGHEDPTDTLNEITELFSRREEIDRTYTEDMQNEDMRGILRRCDYWAEKLDKVDAVTAMNQKIYTVQEYFDFVKFDCQRSARDASKKPSKAASKLAGVTTVDDNTTSYESLTAKIAELQRTASKMAAMRTDNAVNPKKEKKDPDQKTKPKYPCSLCQSTDHFTHKCPHLEAAQSSVNPVKNAAAVKGAKGAKKVGFMMALAPMHFGQGEATSTQTVN